MVDTVMHTERYVLLLAITVAIFGSLYELLAGPVFIYTTRLASKEIFSPSNKIHREGGWAKDLSAPLYFLSISS